MIKFKCSNCSEIYQCDKPECPKCGHRIATIVEDMPTCEEASDNIRGAFGKGKKIYISGKISGMDMNECRDVFKRAEDIIKALGHNPINPLRIPTVCADPEWVDHIKVDIAELVHCDAIWLLNGYRESKGALIELHIARALGMAIINELGCGEVR